MANTLITTSRLADMALAALYEQVSVPQLVHRDWESDLTTRGIGDTIQIRKPATFTANTFDKQNGIKIQEATEGKLEIKMDQIAEVSFAIDDIEMTQDVMSIDSQFITPAVQALGSHMNAVILKAATDAATQQVGVGSEDARPYAYTTPKVLVDAKAKLDGKKAPPTERVSLIGTEMSADWLGHDMIVHADKSGNTEALRNGNIGRNLFGFDVYQTTDIAAPGASPKSGQPTTEVGVAYHQAGIAFASAPLATAANADVQVRSYRGFSIRVGRDYDIKFKRSIYSLDVLYGVNVIRPEWITLLKGADAS